MFYNEYMYSDPCLTLFSIFFEGRRRKKIFTLQVYRALTGENFNKLTTVFVHWCRLAWWLNGAHLDLKIQNLWLSECKNLRIKKTYHTDFNLKFSARRVLIWSPWISFLWPPIIYNSVFLAYKYDCTFFWVYSFN